MTSRFFIPLCFAVFVTAPVFAKKPSVSLIDTLTSNSVSRMVLGGGSIDSFGGGDTLDRRKMAAWFYGNEPIEVCYSRLQTFGLGERRIEEAITDSFRAWSRYFETKKINQSRPLAIDTNFRLNEKCRGTEDLVLYLGTGPISYNLLDLRASQGLHRPVAYVNKTHLSEDLSWSKGYIRFVEDFSYEIEGRAYPDWAGKDHFYQVLVHELGHVLGFAHTPATVMSGDIVKDLFIEGRSYSRQIDFARDLYPCSACRSDYRLVKSGDLAVFPASTRVSFSGRDFAIHRDSSVQRIQGLVEQREVPSPLLTVFQEEGASLKVDALYFFVEQGRGFTLLRDDETLKVIENGALVATFERSRP